MTAAANRGRVVFAAALASMVLLFCAVLAVLGIFDEADATLWAVVLVLSALVLVASITVSIVDLVRQRGSVISVATLLVPVIPVSMVLLLLVTATAQPSS